MQVFSSLLFRKKPCEKISVFCLNSNRHARLEMKVNYATQRRLSTAQTRINQKTQKTNVKQLTNGDGKYNATINDAAESLSIVCVCKCTWFLFRGIRDVVHVIRQKKARPQFVVEASPHRAGVGQCFFCLFCRHSVLRQRRVLVYMYMSYIQLIGVS